MVVDLSPGDVVRIGDDVTLTVLAAEDDLIRFGLESPEECPGAGEAGRSTWSEYTTETARSGAAVFAERPKPTDSLDSRKLD
jgi:hypothetical protein